MKKISLNKQLLLALLGSIFFAITYTYFDAHLPLLELNMTRLGMSFINLLQLVAVPLVVFSIIVSFNSVKNARELSSMGGITLILYTMSTAIAACLGLLIGNIIKPGYIFKWLGGFGQVDTQQIKDIAQQHIPKALPVDSSMQSFIPSNLFALMADNNNLLFIVFFASCFGMALLSLTTKKKQALLTFCEAGQDVFSKMMGYVMHLAPIGVFSLISSQLIMMISLNPDGLPNILSGIGVYVATVVFGLGLLVFGLYPLVVSLFSNIGFVQFLKTMYPAQLHAFTTSSSTGTLYQTSTQVAKLNVPARIRNFVLTLGATVNMDGTALYQSVTMAFITQLFGIEIDTWLQINIVFYLTVSTIGVAGVPGASLVTTTILLQRLVSQGLLEHGQMLIGLGLIYIPDRFLDMCRTTANIEGDATVAVLVKSFEDKRKKMRHQHKEKSDPAGI